MTGVNTPYDCKRYVCYARGMEDREQKLINAVQAELAARGMSKSDLARRLGVARQNVQTYLAGQRGIVAGPFLDMLDALGLELEVRPKSISK